jgi:hypothetical protein
MAKQAKKTKEKYRKDGEFLIAEDEAHIIYRGVTFSWDENYYRCQTQGYSKGLLHRVIWEDHFGPIPEGYHIHHKDANRRNNHPENLQCLEGRIHLSRSAKKSSWVGSQENIKVLEEARKKGEAWHRSEEGREWHRQNAKNVKLGHIRAAYPRKCDHCSKDFTSPQKQGRFCSPKCKVGFRYHSGVDKENRICAHCGKYFSIHRYSASLTCGKTCKLKHQAITDNWHTRKQTQVDCTECGKAYLTYFPTRAKFCTKKCWGLTRKRS